MESSIESNKNDNNISGDEAPINIHNFFVIKYPIVVKFLMKKFSLDINDAEDIAQETILSCLKHYKPTENDDAGSINKYLFTAAVRKTWDFLSKKRNRIKRERQFYISQKGEKEENSIVDLNHPLDAEQELDAKELKKELEYALEHVRPGDLVALEAVEECVGHEGVTIKSIAEDIGITPGALSERVRTMRKHMKSDNPHLDQYNEHISRQSRNR